MHKIQIPHIFFALGILCTLLFLPPFFKSIINLGNLTGMGIALFFLAYGLFFSKINTGIATLWHHRAGKLILIFSGMACLAVVCLAVCITICLISAASKKPPENTNAIVLGCAVHGSKPSLMLQTRLNAACTYLNENPSAKAVLSGGKGSGEDISEAQCMFEYLTEHGIAEDRLYLEDQSENTAQNIAYSKDILKKLQAEDAVTIITNEFHQYRAGILARQAGFVPYSINGKTLFHLLPTYYIRELYAVLNEWFLQ